MHDLTSKYVGKVQGVNPNLAFLEHEIANYDILGFPGGTRSGKTYNIIQWIWYNMERYSGVQYTICRETLASLKLNALKDFIVVGSDLGLYQEKNHDKTEQNYVHNGNIVQFLGAENATKLRGIKQHILYLNEAPELAWESVEQLLFRTEYKVLYDYNPSYPESWVYDKIATRQEHASITTTYRDNPFITQRQLNELLWMKDHAPESYKIYGLGQRGELRGQVYKGWKKLDEWPAEYPSAWIIDFGFSNDPTAITEIKRHNRTLFLRECCYRPELDNVDIAIMLWSFGCKTTSVIIADSAEPKSIAELRRGWDLEENYLKTKCLNLGVEYKPDLKNQLSAGFYVGATTKGEDSINAGIQKVKQHEVFAMSDSENLWKEYYRYHWAEDKKTGALLNVPVDKDNHALDTVRYYCLSGWGFE